MTMRKKQEPNKKLSRKKVEESLLFFIDNCKIKSDMEFGEAEIQFRDRVAYRRGLDIIKDFSLEGIRYIKASNDEKKMTITYLFY